MKRKGVLVLSIISMLFLLGILSLGSNVEKVKASSTIYIRADGSIEGTTDISTIDNVTYTFTDNIYEEIVIERNNIVVDGEGFQVQGIGIGIGVSLSSIRNVTLTNIVISNFHWGISLWNSSFNILMGNNISNNEYAGIYLGYYCSDNTLVGNIVTNNADGIYLSHANENVLTDNVVSSNFHGFILADSGSNTLTNNNASNIAYNFNVFGDSFSHFNNSVDMSNIIDGKSIYYLVGAVDTVLDYETNASTIYLINCNNITIKELTLTNNRHGVFIYNTTNSKIQNVTVSNNYCGIYLRLSSNNTLIGNTISNNPWGGIELVGCTNITLRRNRVSLCQKGFNLISCRFSTLVENHVLGSLDGFVLDWSRNNTLIGNIASNNLRFGFKLEFGVGWPGNNTLAGNLASNNGQGGICLDRSSNNTLYHNSYLNNTMHVESINSTNIWDNGHEGNYWSGYLGIDLNHDGIGDSPHMLDVDNTDHYPLMGPFSSFNTTLGKFVNVISNSTIEDFAYFESNDTIRMHVSNMTGNQTHGFVRICIPHSLMTEPYNITIDGVNPTYWNYTLHDNATHRWIYFAYEHSTLEIVIVPEFTSMVLLPLLMMIMLLGAVVSKRKFR